MLKPATKVRATEFFHTRAKQMFLAKRVAAARRLAAIGKMPNGGQISCRLIERVKAAVCGGSVVSMSIAVRACSAIVIATLGSLANAAAVAASAPAETMRFAIMRNGEQIGTHAIEISHTGAETNVRIATDLAVKVLFVTAYRLQHSAVERWVNGQLVAFNSSTDNNGVRHKVSASRSPSGLEVEADGKTTRVDQNVLPASLWNAELMRRKAAMDPQDGQVDPISVTDDGTEELNLGVRTLKAHHYEIKGRYSQDVWYDERGRLVQVKLFGRDGSVISYTPM
jgi:hypothetical protein